MAFWPLLFATLLYGWTAFAFALKRDCPMAIVYVGYFFANIGFLMYAHHR